MFFAKYSDRLIELPAYPREDYQKLYDLGKAGLLECPVCGKPMVLQMSIAAPPEFTHRDQTDSNECLNAYKPAKAEEPARVAETVGAFRIPKNRSITDSDQPKPSVVWKNPDFPGIITPFTEKNDPFITLFDDITLNQAQAAAVTSDAASTLVLAGAGSGKTRVLTSRAAYLIQETGADPASIMLITFTVKAAKEMKERMASLYGLSMQQVNRMVTGTFHGIFYRILTHHDRERWDSRHLLKEWQREQYVKQAGREIKLDETDFPFDQALQQIGLWKNTRLSPSDIKPEDKWEEQIAFLYTKYEEYKEASGQFDFDDMLLQCLLLLENNESIREAYQNRFASILIDEFQDINQVQYEIIQLLSAKHQSVFAVGDDDQSIYAFRGSNPAFLLQFTKDFPGAKVIHLASNYRSSHEIVATANKMIAKNRERHKKKMDATFTNGIKPMFFYPYDEEEEATLIVNDLKEKIRNGRKPEEFAVLYRTHTGGRAIFERLSESSIPFAVDQETGSFYERKMVRTPLAYLRLAVNPDDGQAMKDLIFALFLKSQVLQDIKALSILNDCSLLEALLHIQDIKPFQQKKIRDILPYFKRIRTMAPLDALNLIEKKMGLADTIKKRGNEGNKMDKGSDDLQDLKVAAKKFSTVPELIDHADHMTALSADIKKSGRNQANGVRLMTIHRSKGLEFPYVYVLGAVDGSIPHDFSLESARNGDFASFEEERRLLYVAMTRAQFELYLSAPQTRRGKRSSPSRFFQAIE
ncbi:ATP-dependent helicase [Bacillus sp. FJAT-42376]|uniref:UvrD-helicase domain-containing protein n=1 Tax=Bacillus sp. FJAT-42376 TaxID=2014076 RepID=UPI000F4F652E|nr:ATP-dependent helicase [Bacillus sp. FJAT-42376]AZB42407.1 ATP-dependent helicase [Bacillus sp. FJAT-42376]